MQNKNLRSILNYSRRIGKGFNQEARNFYHKNIGKYLFSKQSIDPNKFNILEIGFGTGDNIFNLYQHYPEAKIIASEPFLDGVHKVLKKIVDNDIQNISIIPDDIFSEIDNITNNAIDQIYILFPDPWPKLRHHKRRIITAKNISIFLHKLKPEGTITIATDHDSYREWIREVLANIPNLNYLESDQFPEHYSPTKYHRKAIKLNSQISVFTIKRADTAS